MIRDFLRRKAIETKAETLLTECFSDSNKRPESNASLKAMQRKLIKKIDDYVEQSREYIRNEKLGVYGKARYLQVTQQHLLDLEMKESVTESILQRIMA